MSPKVLLTIILLAFSSCGYRNMNKTATAPQGIFKGQFVRSSPLARYAASNVTVDFNRNTFSGDSDKLNYPAICHGTFKINGKNIEFVNECIMTADFDWSYILKDTFEFSLIDSKLEMTKTVGNTTDHYSLRLQ